MKTPVERIRDLKLNGKDIMESMPGNPAEINWPSAEALVDAQFTKLVKGLAEIVREHSRTDEWDEHNEIVSHLAWHLGKAAE